MPLDTLRRIYLNRLTGVLKLGPEGRLGSYYFVAGDLFVAANHQLAKCFGLVGTGGYESPDGGQAGVDGAPGPEPGVGVSEEARANLTALAAILANLPTTGISFEEGTGHIPVDAVGPMPTATLLMDTAVSGRDKDGLMRLLGGEESRYVSGAGPDTVDATPKLDPHEAFLMSRLDAPAAIREVVRQANIEPAKALEKLCRLWSVGLIHPTGRPGTAPDPVEESTAEVFKGLSERIATSLTSVPLELDPETHRKRLRDLFTVLGENNHFTLLGVEPDADEEEIHNAYTNIARVGHPSHSATLGMEEQTGLLELLFERATAAYLTLSDPDRKTAYLSEMDLDGGGLGAVPSSEQRTEEVRHVAQGRYELARAAVSREEYHVAVEILQQAVKIDPQAEYYLLLGQCQARNDQWIGRALTSLSTAVELKPDDAEMRTALGEILEKKGDLARARREFEAALDRNPVQQEALDAVERIKSAEKGKKRGFLARLFSRE